MEHRENWTQQGIAELVAAQRAYFATNQTLDVDWRLAQLKKLKDAIRAHRADLAQALRADLGRTEAEAYMLDIGTSIAEIDEALAALRRWARPETHWSGLMCFPSVVTKVYKLPYGVSLIVSPFNFPVLLSLGVLTAAIAGGNTAVIKASSKSPVCTAALRALIADCFPADYVTVVSGGHETADACLAQRFDKIFYTGSPKVGRHVLEMAADNLTSVGLELGGENGNWCIVRKDAALKDAARKIAFFKACNSGQICIDINQVAVAEEVAEPFLKELKAAFAKQLGKNPAANAEYSRMISRAAYDRCCAWADRYADRLIYGGERNEAELKFAPAILYPVGVDEDIVKTELFCPLLPVVPFPDAQIDGLLRGIAAREHGLALYLFTKDMAWAKKTMATQQYGGGCINEVCMHLMVRGAPFNGVGHSGMGAYHGEWGFREFTHPSTVLIGANHFNLPLREHPFTGAGRWKRAVIERFLR